MWLILFQDGWNGSKNFDFALTIFFSNNFHLVEDKKLQPHAVLQSGYDELLDITTTKFWPNNGITAQNFFRFQTKSWFRLLFCPCKRNHRNSSEYQTKWVSCLILDWRGKIIQILGIWQTPCCILEFLVQVSTCRNYI